MKETKETEMIQSKVSIKKFISVILIVLIMAIISVLILMQSQLNPFGNKRTGSDSAVFIYGGNLIRNGKILYKDFFDHKGPMLYIFEVIGLTLSNGREIGVWVLETIFMFVNLCMLYKISKLYSNSKYIGIFATVISIIPILQFLQCGNFSEEFSLPFKYISIGFTFPFIINLENT